MQKDDLKENEREHPEGLILQYGSCPFCGQVGHIEAAASWDQDKINEAIAESCSCLGSVNYRHQKKVKKNAHEAIERRFPMISAEARDIIHNAVDLIMDGEVKKLTIELGTKTKASISSTTKGGLKVERTENRKETEGV